MAKPDVRMNYASMELMAKEFANAARLLQELSTQIAQQADTLEGGALVGLGGTRLCEMLRGRLLKKMRILMAKMSELQKDVQGAVSATRDGVATAQSRFK